MKGVRKKGFWISIKGQWTSHLPTGYDIKFLDFGE